MPSAIYHPTTGPTKPRRFRDAAQEREYNRLRKAAQRARGRSAAPRRAHIAPITNIAQALATEDADPRAPVPLATRVSLTTRQRLDNASYALTQRSQGRQWSQRAIIERALEVALDEIEQQHNGGLPFSDPPEGAGARARSQRRTQAHQQRAQAAAST